MPIHLKNTLPLRKSCIQHSTEGVQISNGVSQQANPFEKHTPPEKVMWKHTTGGVWISNGVAHFQNYLLLLLGKMSVYFNSYQLLVTMQQILCT